jgi:hypothetical protein
MELRLDRLLRALREQPIPILEAIDRDPLLLKRESGSLVLANPSQALYTPQEQHQLYAKGIVYRRDPYRLVSLPLIKIYNLGERDVTLADLAALTDEPNVRLRFLRKIDGSLVQVFRHEGRVWFTTRGMIEGASARKGQESGEDCAGFDYIGTARRIAAERYPHLLEDASLLENRTLIFELIHPAAQKVTNYGARSDLILLACFDRRRLAYEPYPDVAARGQAHGLSVVDALSPAGATLAEQIERLLAALAGSDQEGSVLQFERPDEVIYRVKVKSPDYLRLMRAMAECTYDRLVTILTENPHLTTWPEVEAFLIAQGREAVPEEVLAFYRPHYERFAAYLADCDRLRAWAEREYAKLDGQLGGRHERDTPAYRKAFAALAISYPYAGLLFAALDGRLDSKRLRKLIRDPEQAKRAVLEVEPSRPERG